MKRRRAVAFLAAALLCVAASVFIYTFPWTIEQRYPVLDLSQCTRIQGYFDDGTSVESTQVTLVPDDPHFDEMIELFQSAAFKTSLRNILPQGTKVHPYKDGDFRWSVMFQFEDVLFPDGDIGSGDMLHVDNFFGEVALSFDGEQIECSLLSEVF